MYKVKFQEGRVGFATRKDRQMCCVIDVVDWK